MFLTYTTSRALFGDLTNNAESSNLTLGDTLINAKIGEIYGTRDWYFLYKEKTEGTVASRQFYDLPHDVGQLLYVTITSGTTRYTPRRATSRRFWDRLNTTISVTSNTPEWYFMFNDQIGFYPTPSTATTLKYDAQTANFTTSLILTGGTSGARAFITADSDSGTTGTLTLAMIDGVFEDNETITDSSTGSATSNGLLSDYITFYYKRVQKELTIADFTTGTITTATTGDETIAGSSTSWTTPMEEDRWFRLTHTNVAADSGDGVWYEIDSVTNGTSLELKKAYAGTSISSAGGAYTIGQASFIPRGFHQVPVYGAVEIYFTSIKTDPIKAQLYKRMYQEGVEQLTREHGTSTVDVSIDDIDEGRISNPNFFIRL